MLVHLSAENSNLVGMEDILKNGDFVASSCWELSALSDSPLKLVYKNKAVTRAFATPCGYGAAGISGVSLWFRRDQDQHD